MNTKYRKTIIAGNWKMNMLSSDVKPFIEELKPLMPKIKTCETVLCVPAVNRKRQSLSKRQALSINFN